MKMRTPSLMSLLKDAPTRDGGWNKSLNNVSTAIWSILHSIDDLVVLDIPESA